MSVNIYNPSTDTLTQVPGTRNNDAAVDTMLNELGAKNLLPNNATTQVVNGVTFTVNDDGSVEVYGTAADGDALFYPYDSEFLSDHILEKGVAYRITGCPIGGSEESYSFNVGTIYDAQSHWVMDYGDGVDLTVPKDIDRIIAAIIVKEGCEIDETFYPMIRFASIKDDTYAPCAKTNRKLTESADSVDPILNRLGAKNLLPNNATTQTVNGVTYTVNSDGTVRANGTATANSYIYLFGNSNITKTFDFPVIGTGCPSDNPNGALRIGFTQGYVDIGEGVNIPSNTPVSPFAFVANGATVNNAVFKPMIRPASIKDITYVPYAKTNRELTEATEDYEELPINLSSGLAGPKITYLSGRAVRYGRLVTMSVVWTGAIQPTDVIFTMPQKFLPPSLSAYGGGSLVVDGSYLPATYALYYTSGVVSQVQTNKEATAGSFVISYLL